MLATKPQPISGVGAGKDNDVMTIYPSMASTGLGRFLGQLYESMPLGNFPVKLSHLLFPLPLSPISVMLYFMMKIFGVRYILSSKAVNQYKALGNEKVSSVELSQINEVALSHSAGQEFYKAADIVLLGKDGSQLMVLAGIPRAEVFRQTILKARDAQQFVASSMATIQAR